MRLSKKITGIAIGLITATSICAAAATTNFYSSVFALAPYRGGTCEAINYGVDIYDENFQGTINLSSSTAIAGSTNVYTKDNKGLKFGKATAGGKITFTLSSNYIAAYVWAAG